MKITPLSSHLKSDQLFVVTCLTFIVLTIGSNTVGADEVPAFFLKIAKNIPRVGRSDRSFNDYHLKTLKSTPEIDTGETYISGSESSSSNLQDFTQLQKRMIESISHDLNAATWKNFPLSIEGPPELWRTLASYANSKYGTSTSGISNELRRKKRMDTPASLI